MTEAPSLRGRLGALAERLGLVASGPGDDRFHAFISYSHAVDGRLAPALQRGLQRFAKPWYRARALRIFRDEASLSADPGLWSSIVRALDSSQFFVLLASTQAAASPWVAREAEYWAAHEPVSHLLIGLTEGDLVWDEQAGDFDWERTSALPTTLRGVFAEEPRFIDLRWAESADDLSLSHPAFRDAVAEFAAPLHGLPKDELAGEEVRQHRRTVAIARGAALSLVALTALAIAGGVVALLQRNQAVAQRQRAVSRLAAAQALGRMDTSIDTALLLAVAAYREARTPEAVDSLLAGAQRSARVVGVLRVRGKAYGVAFSPDGGRIATAGDEGVAVWGTREGRRLATIAVGNPPARAVAFGPGSTLAFVDLAGRATVWAAGRGRVAVSPRSLRVSSLAFRPGSATLALGTDRGVALWAAPFGTRAPRLVSERGPVEAVAFNADGNELAAAGDGVGVLRCAAATCSERVRAAAGSPVRDVAFAARDRLALVRADGKEELWSLGTGGSRPEPVGSGFLSVAAGPRGTLATGSTSGAVRLGAETLRGQGDWVADVAFAPGGGVLAAASYDGTVVLRRTGTGSLRHDARGLDELEDATFVTPTHLAAAGFVLGSGGVFACDAGGCAAPPAAPASDQVRLASDGHGSVAAADGDTLTLWRAGLGRPPVHAKVRGVALGVALSPDGRELAQGGARGSVGLWRAAPRLELARTLHGGGTQAVGAVAFGAGGKLVAAGDQAGRVVLWELDRGDELTVVRRRGEAVRALAFSADGGLLAFAGADQRITLWDVRVGRPRAILQRGGAVTSLAFAPDGRTLASSEETTGTRSLGTVALWQVDQQPILGQPLGEPGAPVSALSFRPGGGTLLVARRDGSLSLWSDQAWNVDRAVERICAAVGRPLTSAEWREISPDGAPPETCEP